ncbi:MAG: DUF58 domain-containing protein [Bradymonadia bacterium]
MHWFPVILLLLVVVAVVRLVRWRRRRRGGRRTRLKFTGTGQAFVGLTLTVGFAAINTGNNLLYLLLGMQLSMIVVSGVLSELALRSLSLTRQPPGEIYAGVPFLTQITLTNNKRRVPSFSLEVEDHLEGQETAKKCFFLKLPPESTLQTSYRMTCPRRGEHHLTSSTLSTRFPFGFFRKLKRADVSTTLLVYPAIEPVSPLLHQMSGRQGQQPRQARGHGQEFHGLRAHRPGDDIKSVHWKRSARTGQLIVRERAADHARTILLVVHDVLAEGVGMAPASLTDALATLAASVLAHLVDEGAEVTMLLGEDRFLVTADRRGWRSAMTALARMSTRPAGSPLPELAGGFSGGRILLTTPLNTPMSATFDLRLEPQKPPVEETP